MIFTGLCFVVFALNTDEGSVSSFYSLSGAGSLESVFYIYSKVWK